MSNPDIIGDFFYRHTQRNRSMDERFMTSDIPGTNTSLLEGTDVAVTYVADRIIEAGIYTALETYARKKPLTFVGRVIGHGLPFVGIAFWAYDAYQIIDHFN